MKFTVSQSDLSSAMAFVTSAVESKSTMPILQNVLIVACNDKLKLTCTNLSLEKSAFIKASIESSGSITVPARKLLDFAKNADSTKDILFELSGAEATIKSGRSRWKLSTLLSSEFPEILTNDEESKFVEVDIQELSKGIKKTSSAMANKDNRYYLNGMLFDIKNDGVTIVATDGHRMSMYKIDSDNDFEKQSIVMRDSVPDISRMIDDETDVKISVSANYFRLTSETKSIKTKLIDGKYPDYNRVLPKEFNGSAEFSKIDIERAIRRAMPLANEKYKGFRFTFSNDTLRVQASNQQQEEAFEEIPCNVDGDDVEIGFNGEYVQDAVSNIDADSVVIQIRDAGSSIRIDSGRYTSTIMPMRL